MGFPMQKDYNTVDPFTRKLLIFDHNTTVRQFKGVCESQLLSWPRYGTAKSFQSLMLPMITNLYSKT